MTLKSLLVATAGLAAVSNAFLIVPAASSGEIGAGRAPPSLLADSPFPIEALRTAESQILELNCPGCPITLQNHWGQVRVLTNVASHLQLNFTITHKPESDELLLNDFPLYPEIRPSSGREALTAPQIPYLWMRHHVSDVFRGRFFRHAAHHRQPLEPKLGYRVQTLTYPEKEHLSLVALDIQIFQVGRMSVDGIQSVHVTLIKGPNNSLLLRSIDTTVSQTLQPTPMDRHEECATLMCKWASIVQDRLSKIKPAFKHCFMMSSHRGKGPHAHAHGGNPDNRRPAVLVVGHGSKPGWLQLFRNIAAHILLPIAIGLMAGVIFSLIGMAVGTLMVTLWRALFRHSSTRHRSRRGGSVSKTSRRETPPAEEKSGLLERESQDDEEDDVPPKYEEGEDKIVV